MSNSAPIFKFENNGNTKVSHQIGINHGKIEIDTSTNKQVYNYNRTAKPLTAVTNNRTGSKPMAENIYEKLKDYINDNHAVFLACLNMSDLLISKLYSQGVILESEKCDLRAIPENNRIARALEFIDILLKCTDRLLEGEGQTLRKLVECLEKLRQVSVANVLKDSLNDA